MKFLVMMLHKGKYNGQQILSEDAVDQMMEIQDKPEQIKYAPKAAEGFMYALGSWVVEEESIPLKANKSHAILTPPGEDEMKRIVAALACPGLFGTWPMVDFCRGYAYIVFVKNLLGEERADAHMGIKRIIDKQIASDCK
jgi:CubicO group peptidase (beta-lactamase class C family)